MTGDASSITGDPDGATGVGRWTLTGQHDTAANTGVVTTDRDSDGKWEVGDWDCLNTTGWYSVPPVRRVGQHRAGHDDPFTARHEKFHMGKTTDAAGDGYGIT